MIGKKIQNYTVTSYLGEGGMGTVYKASDDTLGREVALKMLHGTLVSQAQFLERFKKEARVLAQLLHPNIAVIYNFIGQDDHHFMVMEYVEGSNLDSLVRKHKCLPPALVVPMFLQILEGLHHAHRKGIFHRDIKPSNLILTPDATVKLMDFGIAKIAGEQRMTQVNRVVGTIEYMAPELIEGKDPSIASDIYAAGVTMYEMLTGKLPFEGNTDFTLMQDILKKKPVSIDKLNASIPSSLSAIVMKTLEKKPEHRYLNAKAFQLALMQAFPQFREIDLQILTAPIATTQQVQLMTRPGKKAKPTVLQDPRSVTSGHSVTIHRIQNYCRAYFTRQKAPVLIGAVCMLVALAMIIPQLLNTDDRPQKDEIASQVSTDSSKIKNNDKDLATSFSSQIEIPGNLSPSLVPENQVPADTKPAEEKKEETRKEKTGTEKKAGKQEEQTDPKKIEENTVIPEPEKKAEENIVDVKPEPNVVTTLKLASRIAVDLYLQQAISESTAREGQVLHFTVSRPVLYNGETIIPKGASATGRIKNIGRKKMTIVLNSVNSTSGHSLPFESIELSGRTEDIIASRNYSGTIKKGTTIHF